MRISKTSIKLAAIFATGASVSVAQEWLPNRLYIPLASYHHKVDSQSFGLVSWNESNPGMVFSWEDRLAGLDFSAGLFKNSYSDWSTYISMSKLWDIQENISIGAFISLADYHEKSTYFDYKIGDYAVIVGAQVNIESIFFQIQPVPVDSGIGAVLASGLHFQLSQR